MHPRVRPEFIDGSTLLWVGNENPVEELLRTMEQRTHVKCGRRPSGPGSADVHLGLFGEIRCAAKVSLPELVMAALADGVKPPVTARCLGHRFCVIDSKDGENLIADRPAEREGCQRP